MLTGHRALLRASGQTPASQRGVGAPRLLTSPLTTLLPLDIASLSLVDGPPVSLFSLGLFGF